MAGNITEDFSKLSLEHADSRSSSNQSSPDRPCGASSGSSKSYSDFDAFDDSNVSEYFRVQSIHAAVKPGTHDWKAYNAAASADSASTNVLDYLFIKVNYEQLDDILSEFELMGSKEVEKIYGDTREDFFKLMDKSEGNFDIPVAKKTGSKDQGKLFFGYPNCKPHASNVGKLLQRCASRIMKEYRLRGEFNNSSEDPIGHLNHMVRQFQGFIHELVFFLENQQKVTERAYEGLFSSLCAVAGLDFADAAKLKTREFDVYNVRVSSRPDLRAIHPKSLDFNDVIPGQFKLERDRKQVLAVAEVKCSEQVPVFEISSSESLCSTRSHSASALMHQGKQSDISSSGIGGPVGSLNEQSLSAVRQIRPVLGQLLGEMLAEFQAGTTHYAEDILGFAVQCTKVQVVAFHLPTDLQEYLFQYDRKQLKAGEVRAYQGEWGKALVSKPMDFMCGKDRVELLRFMMRVSSIK